MTKELLESICTEVDAALGQQKEVNITEIFTKLDIQESTNTFNQYLFFLESYELLAESHKTSLNNLDVKFLP